MAPSRARPPPSATRREPTTEAGPCEEVRGRKPTLPRPAELQIQRVASPRKFHSLNHRKQNACRQSPAGTRFEPPVFDGPSLCTDLSNRCLRATRRRLRNLKRHLLPGDLHAEEM